jgi:crotonobetainyl-CoA:carnitine CoA-transferase CaiB-like acyl-CoA transferase
MKIEMPHKTAGKVPLIRGPMRSSATPVEHKIGPPLLGQHTDEVLAALGKSAEEIARLKSDGIV